jgi:hypothetical protein
MKTDVEEEVGRITCHRAFNVRSLNIDRFCRQEFNLSSRSVGCNSRNERQEVVNRTGGRRVQDLPATLLIATKPRNVARRWQQSWSL